MKFDFHVYNKIDTKICFASGEREVS